MRKASNILEVGLLLSFIALIAFGAMTMYNNQKLKLTNLSNPNIRPGVNLSTMNAAQGKEKVSYNRTETAGTNALTYLAQVGITPEQFDSAMSNITYNDLKAICATAAAAGQKDIFALTNDLNTSLNLGYDPVSPENVGIDTLPTFVGVFNAATAVKSDSPAKADASAFVDQANTLVKSQLGADVKIPETAGSSAK